jgi:hypothetical protein
MKPGDRAIYFKPPQGSGYKSAVKFNCELVRLTKTRAVIKLADGKIMRVDIENVQVVK